MEREIVSFPSHQKRGQKWIARFWGLKSGSSSFSLCHDSSSIRNRVFEIYHGTSFRLRHEALVGHKKGLGTGSTSDGTTSSAPAFIPESYLILLTS